MYTTVMKLKRALLYLSILLSLITIISIGYTIYLQRHPTYSRPCELCADIEIPVANTEKFSHWEKMDRVFFALSTLSWIATFVASRPTKVSEERL